VDYLVEAWPLAAGDLVDWKVDRDENVASGKCPACTHPTIYPFEPDAVAQGVGSSVPDGASREIHCDCEQTHLEGTTQRTSCGRYWYARILPEGNVPPIVAETDKVLQHVARTLARTSRVEEEKTVRAAADKWVTGITALLGLFGISGIAFGKDVFGGLTGTAKWALGVALIVVVLAASLAVLWTFQAAYGWPRRFDTSNVTGIRKWYRRVRAAAGNAARSLRLGVYSALLAVVALCVAVAAIWFGSAPPTPLVSVTLIDGTTICGDLIGSSSAGMLRVHTSSGEVKTINASELAKISNVAKCA
jgi:hypothetical protein